MRFQKAHDQIDTDIRIQQDCWPIILQVQVQINTHKICHANCQQAAMLSCVLMALLLLPRLWKLNLTLKIINWKMTNIFSHTFNGLNNI